MIKKTFYLMGLLTGLSALLIIYSAYQIETASEGKTFSTIDKLPYNKVGVVLGCASKLMNGRTNLYFQHRINAAVKLYVENKIDVIIVSGDNSRKSYDEPTDMKNALIEKGVPEQHIYCDYAGFRTLDSIVRTKSIFDCEKVTIISQEFHNKRALFIAKYKGVDAVGYNAEDVSVFNSFRTDLRELLAKVKTVLDIHLLNTQPKFAGPKVLIAKN